MQVHIATSTVPRTFKSRISYPFSDTVEAHIPVTARPMPNSSKLTVAKTLAEALRHKTQSLALVLTSSQDLQCRNLLCEKVGEACICRLSHVLESLQDVRQLNLAANKLTSLPASIWQLPHLITLDLSDNLLTDIPPEAAQLSSLEDLNLQGNARLKPMPRELSKSLKLNVRLPQHLC